MEQLPTILGRSRSRRRRRRRRKRSTRKRKRKRKRRNRKRKGEKGESGTRAMNPCPYAANILAGADGQKINRNMLLVIRAKGKCKALRLRMG